MKNSDLFKNGRTVCFECEETWSVGCILHKHIWGLKCSLFEEFNKPFLNTVLIKMSKSRFNVSKHHFLVSFSCIIFQKYRWHLSLIRLYFLFLILKAFFRIAVVYYIFKGWDLHFDTVFPHLHKTKHYGSFVLISMLVSLSPSISQNKMFALVTIIEMQMSYIVFNHRIWVVVLF